MSHKDGSYYTLGLSHAIIGYAREELKDGRSLKDALVVAHDRAALPRPSRKLLKAMIAAWIAGGWDTKPLLKR